MNSDEKERLKQVLERIVYRLTRPRPPKIHEKGELYTLIQTLFDEPEKKEMTAKELVERMEAIIESGEYVPWGSPDHVVARFRKEAGL